MPVWNPNTLQQHPILGSSFGFSAKRIEDLGASEYTLVAVAADVSGSVSPFAAEIEQCVKHVVRSCRHSPRADNLMLRLVTFDSTLTEVHGFKPLSECDLAGYDGCIRSGGTTALYDAAFSAVEAATRYGEALSAQDFGVNVIVFVITDGGDNASSMTSASVADALHRAISGEAIESALSILVGVNVQDAATAAALRRFQAEAGFSRYIELGDARPETLARLAEFVSRSISAQSLSLGSGGASRVLSF